MRGLGSLDNWLEDAIGFAAERNDLNGLLQSARNRALFHMVFGHGLSATELATLTVERVNLGTDSGLRIVAPGSKQHATVENTGTSPATPLRLWLAVSGISQGFVFRHINRGKLLQQPLSPRNLDALIEAMIRLAGLSDELDAVEFSFGQPERDCRPLS